MRECIDRLDQIDLETLTAEDLICGVRPFSTKVIITQGKKTYIPRDGIMTKLGNVEIGVWLEAAEFLVKRDGLQKEVERMAPFVAFPFDNRSAQYRRDARIRAIDACFSRLYQNVKWVHFIEYNEKYHPELLDLWDNRDE